MDVKKILYAATVVKTHIMQFHVPYLKMLQNMGWRTEVAAKNDYENPDDCVIPYCDAYHDIPFERAPWHPRNLTAYRELKKLIRENRYDVIHCHTPVGAMVTRLAAISARKQGTTVIYTAHGFHFFKGAPLLNWLVFFPAEWMLSPLTDILVTINKEDYATAKKYLHAKKVVYIPGVGVDRERFCPDPGVREPKRTELGFTDQDFLILTVAEMTKNKNHAAVIHALACLRTQPEFIHLHYLIVGRGTEQKNLQRLAESLGLQEHVHFLGYRADVEDLYRAADIFAFMSFREGLSLALMEAMSSGLPAVCAKIRGNTDLIEDRVSGLFTENNPEALSEAILKLYRNPDLREKIALGAVKKTAEFDRHVVQGCMRKLYEEL